MVAQVAWGLEAVIIGLLVVTALSCLATLCCAIGSEVKGWPAFSHVKLSSAKSSLAPQDSIQDCRSFEACGVVSVL